MTIYATAKPVEEYVSSDGSVGLYVSYSHRPAVLAFSLIFTHFGYLYESQYIAIDENKIPAGFADIDLIERSLQHVLGGITVKELLTTKSPLDVLNHLQVTPDEDIMEMPFVKETKIFTDAIMLRYVVAARVYVWMSNRRGVLERSGNVTRVAFGGNSTPDVPEIFRECHNAMLLNIKGMVQ